MSIAATGRAAAAAASLLVLSSCGSLPESADFLSRDSEFLQQSPRAIAKAAFKEMRAAKSFRMLGSVNTDEYGAARLDVRVGDTNCTGSYDTEDGGVQFIQNDKGSWLKPDDRFWRSQSSSQVESQVLDVYSGSWLADQQKGLAEICDIDRLLRGFKVDEGDRGKIDAGDVEKIGDVDAIALTGRDGKKRCTVWVAVEAPHVVVKLTQNERGELPEVLSFEEFGAEVLAESPPKKDIVQIPGD